MRRVLLGLASASIVAFAACSSSGLPSADARIATGAGPVTLHVRVADTESERAKGLMGVTDLSADDGMAFLYDGPTRVSFWMKDTPTPLSIAFWGADGRILSVMDMPPCAAEPCPTYRPASAFVGALEANRGFFAGHGVEVGDRVVIVR